MKKDNLMDAVIQFTLKANSDIEFDIIDILIDHQENIEFFVNDVIKNKTT